MLRMVKRAAFTFARASGVFSVVAGSGWREKRLLILCYHGVSIADEHEWNGQLYVSPEFLRDRCERLVRAGYNVMHLADAVNGLRSGTLPPRAVAITFDDGMYDFSARALPVLAEFGLPATNYVATYYSSFQRPVFDPTLAYVAWKGRSRGACSGEGLVPGTRRLDVATAEQRSASVQLLRDSARKRGLDAAEKDELIRAFADRLEVDYDEILKRRILHLMTPEELAALPRDLVDVQMHTHRHRTPLDQRLFSRELEDNRHALAATFGCPSPFRHFCYPSGAYHEEFLPWLRAFGIESATTCEPGLASAKHDPLLLPRFIDTMHQNQLSFEAWTSGVADLLPRRSHRNRPAA